jgi:hypothetical protein
MHNKIIYHPGNLCRACTPVNHRAKLSFMYPDTLSLRTAAACYERLLNHRFQGADIFQHKFLTVTFGIELGTRQTTSDPLTTLHRIGIERPGIACSTAGEDLRVQLTDVADMMAEYN